jgi:EAL domain-containing protein (putative c-di-GMP-specific phosphodiesterase class I)
MAGSDRSKRLRAGPIRLAGCWPRTSSFPSRNTPISQLDAFGVNVSLDDFGIGQTSLEYLSALPIDELKIDKTFVLDMLTNDTHAAIVRSIIDLGHNLGLRVVAEGIESAAVLHALDELGCDDAQGFFLARPMLVSDLARFLAATRQVLRT